MTTKYHIDEMQGDELLALHIAHGTSALEAMNKVTAGPFVIRTVQAHCSAWWITAGGTFSGSRSNDINLASANP